MSKIYDLIIIGGGPAGLMAANVAQQRNLRYLIIDSNNTLGKKLLITGGSRCNVTNRYDVREFIDKLLIKNKRFLYSTLKNFGTNEVIAFLKSKGVELVLENDIKYFPKSSKSRDILNAMTSEIPKDCIKLDNKVVSITKNETFTIRCKNSVYTSKNVLISTGSKSYPQTGSTGDGALFAELLGHNVIPFYPAETNVHSGFISSQKEFLQGISISNSTLKIRGEKQKYHGDFIFTHFGLGGPVIQTASEFIYHSMKTGNNVIELSLTQKTEEELKMLFSTSKNLMIQKLLESILIKRLARFLMKYLKIENIKIQELNKKQIIIIINTLKHFAIKIDRVEEKERSYVNGGGVTTDEINPKTMESKLIKGLYFAGEVTDIHGPIGGFNITIAMSMGCTAIKSI